MKLVYLSSLVICLSLCISCQKGSKQEAKEVGQESTADSLDRTENELYKQVMNIHDTLMSQMSEIMALNKKIKKKTEGELTNEEKKEVEDLSAKLEAANESMMDWMRKFNPNLENMSHEETISYLNAEMTKIQQVKENMEDAQEKAQAFLSKQ